MAVDVAKILRSMQECAQQETKSYFEVRDGEDCVCDDLIEIKTSTCCKDIDDWFKAMDCHND